MKPISKNFRWLVKNGYLKNRGKRKNRPKLQKPLVPQEDQFFLTAKSLPSTEATDFQGLLRQFLHLSLDLLKKPRKKKIIPKRYLSKAKNKKSPQAKPGLPPSTSPTADAPASATRQRDVKRPGIAGGSIHGGGRSVEVSEL